MSRIMPSSRKKPHRDGGWQLVLDRQQPVIHFAHKEQWTARDVALMDDAMRRWYRTQYCDIDIIVRHHLAPDEDPQQLEINRQANSAAFASPERMSVLMSPDAALMAEAAAMTMPDEELRPEHFPAPNGVLYFRVPQLFTDMNDATQRAAQQEAQIMPDPQHYLQRAQDSALIPVRAISWSTWADGQYLRYQLFGDGPTILSKEYPKASSRPGLVRVPDEVFSLVNAFAFGDGTFAGAENPEGENLPSFSIIAKYIRAAFAIAAAAGSEDRTDEVRIPRPKTKRGKKQPPRRVDVRTVSLVRPEYARYEMDAVTGRKLRAHWVRGHWRKQWYASEEEHRTLWIEGHMRGDARLGSVAGAKVHTISAKPDPKP